VLPVCLAALTKQGERRSNVAFPFCRACPRMLAQKAAHVFKSADGSGAFCMLKAEHLRLAAKLSLSLALAVRTEEPEVV
jgi:hypothetical protein